MTTPADCRQCGACCFSQAERYVVVTGDDWTRLGSHADQVAHFIGHRAYMKMVDGHCAALAATLSDNGPPDYFCTLYDQRPQICRDLERGSPQCEADVMKAR